MVSGDFEKTIFSIKLIDERLLDSAFEYIFNEDKSISKFQKV